MKPEDELTFSDFMSACWTPLYRTAYLLTGNEHEAEDLSVTTHSSWTSPTARWCTTVPLCDWSARRVSSTCRQRGSDPEVLPPRETPSQSPPPVSPRRSTAREAAGSPTSPRVPDTSLRTAGGTSPSRPTSSARPRSPVSRRVRHEPAGRCGERRATRSVRCGGRGAGRGGRVDRRRRRAAGGASGRRPGTSGALHVRGARRGVPPRAWRRRH